MTELPAQITVVQAIAYVIEIHVDGGGEPVRVEIDGESLHTATALAERLHSARPVYTSGEFRPGWINLIAVTDRSPEPRGVLIGRRWWEP